VNCASRRNGDRFVSAGEEKLRGSPALLPLGIYRPGEVRLWKSRANLNIYVPACMHIPYLADFSYATRARALGHLAESPSAYVVVAQFATIPLDSGMIEILDRDQRSIIRLVGEALHDNRGECDYIGF